jgi:hypothetical protein
MSDAYTRETLLLSSEIEKYASLDPFDPERPKVVQVIPTLLSTHADTFPDVGMTLKSSVFWGFTG